MKHIILILVLVSTFATTTHASDTNDVPVAAIESFQKSFTSARETTWSTGKGYLRVDFFFNNQYVTGYYKADGQLIALTKNILSTQLPLMLETSLKSNYSCYWISDLVEVSKEEGVTYYVTVENADGKMILKSEQNNWTLHKRIRH